ncbi:DUF4912 domain-containing protein [Cytobacillus spongiae]|uniref:DUF4912 domain-containing protein n=1 Tax=Cytobacillus spongiae TaxID=2901381 RepID=UPI001F38E017|nr:DUF4912 domain-containing protein [Cytobacillus spongiae]UII54868.1 DUF4912 domain-containing protein [Cytobacillus spongiae]
MIEDIVKLRRRGLSFRKIAKELNSTVGKVQYQWNKHKQAVDIEEGPPGKIDREIPHVDGSILERKFSVEEDGLVSWLISNNRMLVFWKISSRKADVIQTYFEKPISKYLMAIRTYDVTDIFFNGSNAHSHMETILPERQSYWYVKGLKPNHCYLIELGLKISENQFFPISRSNTVHVPRNSFDQVGTLGAQLETYQNHSGNYPNWVEHVSTYSYYGGKNEGGNE